jgi:hypothetical protein
MNRRTALTLSTMTLLCLGVALPSAGIAQTAKDLVGNWMLISADTVRSDGSRVRTFGDKPRGPLPSPVMVALFIYLPMLTFRNLHPTTAPRELPRRIRQSCRGASRFSARIRQRTKNSR